MGGATFAICHVVIVMVSFNRRGDSLGGATTNRKAYQILTTGVSIAEAILWGEQPTGDSHRLISQSSVSIAEAILWGEQPEVC